MLNFVKRSVAVAERGFPHVMWLVGTFKLTFLVLSPYLQIIILLAQNHFTCMNTMHPGVVA
jgi:hypothetical protein